MTENGTRPSCCDQGWRHRAAHPETPQGSFFPSILEPRRRIDQGLYAVMIGPTSTHVSTRSVENLVAAMGADSGISTSEVSRICEGLDESVGAFR